MESLLLDPQVTCNLFPDIPVENLCSHKNMYMSVQYSFIPLHPKLKKGKMTFKW